METQNRNHWATKEIPSKEFFVVRDSVDVNSQKQSIKVAFLAQAFVSLFVKCGQ